MQRAEVSTDVERALAGAVVLAGGASRRMGVDKPTLRVEGERLVDRAVRRLSGVSDRIVVAVGADRHLDVAGADEVVDPGVGPLGGIAAGLAHLDVGGSVAVVASDAPHVSPRVLLRLAELRGDADAAVPLVDDVLQPLHAVWRGGLSTALSESLAGGRRSPTAVLSTLEVVLVDEQLWRPHDREARFAVSWDRPGDLPAEVAGRQLDGEAP